MNATFLFLIAIPLGLYLLVLLFSTRDVGGSDTAAESVTVAQPVAVAEPVTVAQPELAPSVATAAVTTLVTSKEAQTERVEIEDNASAPAAEQVETGAAPLAAVELAETGEAPMTSMEHVETVAAPAKEAEPAETTALAAEKPSIGGAPVASASLAETKVNAPGEAVEAVTPAEVSPEPETLELEGEPILPEGPLVLPGEGSPKYAFDYRGRLWVEKKRKSFFRQLRRPQIPPEEPG